MAVEHGTMRMSVHSGVQERLGRVAKISTFYLVGYIKDSCDFKMGSWDLGIILECLPNLARGTKECRVINTKNV